MALLRILIHSFILCLVNLGAVLAGFAVYEISGAAYQLAVQISVAVAISVAAFALWYYLTLRITSGRIALGNFGAYVGTYVLALAWFPVVFVPLHYVTQGYLTSFANIYNMWLFQAPTNAAALVAANFAGRRAAGQYER
jgi:hypothetical protein